MGTKRHISQVSAHVKSIFPFAALCLASVSSADPIDDYVQNEMKRLQIPEVTIGIIKNGKLVRAQAYGESDPVTHQKGTTQDLFEVGSITKQFTALATLMLVEEGKIGLEDSISKYLPEIPAAWSNVKVRNLLNQNSGLPEYALVPGLGLLEKYDRKTFMERIVKEPIDFLPGVAWAYSNTNYAFLGWIIEKVTDKSYATFMQERVLKPLGMNHSSFAESGVDVPGLAKGYIRDGNASVTCPRGGASIKSDGALVTNLEDMVKWDDALRRKALIGRKSYELLWSPGKLNNGRTRAYGMGWFLNQPLTGEYQGHGGNDAGYSAGISRFPKERLSVLMFSNLYPVGGEAMTKGIAELVEPKLKVTEPKTSSDPNPVRTGLIQKALAALSTGTPDDALLEPEVTAPLKTSRAKQFGNGLWGQIQKVDRMDFAGQHKYGRDTFITYVLTSGSKQFVTTVLWSAENKIAQGSLSIMPKHV